MTTLTERFSGARLVEAMASQKLIQGNRELAEKFVEKGELISLKAGEILITQGGWDSEIYFILAGDFSVLVNDQEVHVRGAGELVGELTGMKIARSRTATVKSIGEALVLKVALEDAQNLGEGDADFWKRVADGVADQLDHRNKSIGKVNDIPRVFVISSTEGKHVVDEIIKRLDGDKIHIDPWDEDTFGLSDYPISSLMDRIAASDFTVSIVRADDILISRKKTHNVARDNVHLEYGISLGLLGRLRSILLVCGSSDVKLPSDAAGLTTLRYKDGDKDEMKRTVRNACLELKEYIEREGVFKDRRA